MTVSASVVNQFIKSHQLGAPCQNENAIKFFYKKKYTIEITSVNQGIELICWIHKLQHELKESLLAEITQDIKAQLLSLVDNSQFRLQYHELSCYYSLIYTLPVNKVALSQFEKQFFNFLNVVDACLMLFRMKSNMSQNDMNLRIMQSRSEKPVVK